MARVAMFSCALLLVASLALAEDPATTEPATAPAAALTAELTVRVVHADTGAPLTAWVRVESEADDNVGGWYKKGRKGLVCPTSMTLAVPEGRLTLTAWSHVGFEPASQTIDMPKDGQAEVTLQLRPRLDLHKMGYFSIDSHNHINGGAMPNDVVGFCRASGIDHVDVCQGWMTKKATYAEIVKMLEDMSTPDVSLTFGAEMPKLRYGHTWYVNHPGLDDPHGDYLKWHDAAYFDAEGRDASNGPLDLRGEFAPKWHPPFVDRILARKKGAVAVAAHPTSWWHNGPNETYPATNVAVDLAFDMIAAHSYDGMVVMGYDHDHIFYQYIWFNLLDRGYRLTPMAESDGNVETGSLGEDLTYVWTGKDSFSLSDVVNGIRAGHTTLSGNAFMHLTVDGSLPAGTALPADGKPHTIDVEVYSAAEPQEYISYLLLFRNGKLAETLDLRETKPRYLKHSFAVSETDTAYYVVKCHGRVYPQDERNLDVRTQVEQVLQDGKAGFGRNSGVAIAAPVYFDAPDWRRPQRLVSHIQGQVVDQAGQPLQTKLEIWDVDEKLAELTTDSAGRFEIDAPATIDVRFTTPDGKPQQQWLFYEYAPLLDLVEDTYTIAWAKRSPVQAGQMPWEAFHFDEIRDVLKNVNWTIKAR